MTRPETRSQEPAINFPELLARVENDKELLLDLIAMFREEYPQQRQQLQSALDAADMKQVHTLGHTLKGMFANLAMTPASKTAARIEQAGKEANTAELKVALPILDQEVANLFVELDKDLTDIQV